MKKIEDIQRLVNCLKNPNNESLQMSMSNVHGDGIFSLVIDGKEHGRLTRAFIAEKKLRPYDVQLHTHRYPIRLTVVKGNITHHRAFVESPCPNPRFNSYEMPLYNYKSPLNGGNGLSYVKDVYASLVDHKMPIGSTIHLWTDDFHTMSVSKGSIWIVEELGFEKDYSQVLGVPFITDGLYTKPEQFQINDKAQLVWVELTKMLFSYKSIDTREEAEQYSKTIK